MENFRKPGERPPRAGHRRHASTSLVTLVPTTLQASRAREELVLRAADIVVEWLRKQASSTTQPAAPAQPVATPGDTAAHAAPAALSPPGEPAPHGAPLPPSEDEEAMDSSSSLKRSREAESEEDEAVARRKQPLPLIPPRWR